MIINLVNTENAANALGITRKTLERWRITGEGPTYIKLGRRVVYSVADLEGFVEKGRRNNTAEYQK